MPGSSAIGIDIGGTHLRAARVGADGTILARASRDSARDPAVVLARCLALIAEILAADPATGPVKGAGSGTGADPVTGIGIGIPGQVNLATRRILSGGYVDLSGIDFAGEVQAATGLPVTLDNDAGMALLAEVAQGAAKGCANVVMLTIGTGIGGAVLEGGQVLRGAGAAGQLGHLVVSPFGRPCVCGRTGCVETESSGTAFGVHLAEAGLPPSTRAQDLLARPDDPVAARVIAAWAGPLRRAIDTLIATCNPDMVVIGGGAGAAAVAALDRVPADPSWFSAPVVGAVLGDDAGVVGAALSALRAATAPKRAVLVNGVPASGKSAVARALSDATGWPLLTLDTIKNPFLVELGPSSGPGDRPFNRRLGRASYDAIFDLLADAPPGSVTIVDAWFGFQPADVLKAGLASAGIAEVAEVWCHAPPEVIGDRYASRVGARPSGHPGLDYVPELVALAGRAQPMALGPVRKIDTALPLDIPALTRWISTLWP